MAALANQNNMSWATFAEFIRDEIVGRSSLVRLPVASLAKFKSISKPWHAIISDQAFVRAHLQCSKQKQHRNPPSFLISPLVLLDPAGSSMCFIVTNIRLYLWLLEEDTKKSDEAELLYGRSITLTPGAVWPAQASAARRHYNFYIRKVNVSRLCRQRSILTVNGQFPGPTIYARKGDVVVVKVHNHGERNVTIHWHGVKQPRNPWSDGPEYITQCPIKPGGSFTYRVILSEEEGTLWWHAHTGFDRATLHGAIVIHPKQGTKLPFFSSFPPSPLEKKKKKKVEEVAPIILGEWWRDDDVNQLLEDAMRTGEDVKPADANTINGQPGDLFFSCSSNDSFKVRVEQGKTYLLRVINAGLTNDMFFGVAGHRLTVVATDARYTKPFTVDHVMVASGQTLDLLLHANNGNHHGVGGRYYMAARTFVTDTAIAFNNSTATAILEYTSATSDDEDHHHQVMPASFPVNLPAVDDMAAATAFQARLRSLASPVDVPAHVDERMLVTMAVNLLPCAPHNKCSGPKGDRLAASLNNVSFVNPTTVDLLRAYYYKHNVIRGVYDAGFPDEPPSVFNFTGPADQQPGPFTARGTKVKVLEYGRVVEVVFQDTAVLGTESHPMHLHGFSFYVVGRGSGNFDERKDPINNYNLIDPPCQNTVSVPKGGWAAIRFRATNPGVWFMHCHFDRHMVWGMNTVFIVKDGKSPHQKMIPPPHNMPKC
ncbi:hypothetical protein PR202_ga14349 [Eleusine coracana subsp. coracana]|uniref:Laccase n=1 Tax=Eleusine coracana subsp. coracana TaxID=191504 RepID=A0AAV5CH78_ELECO|nr:hypothetical protein PR202_ga14349 [Eleusine coracana subsp. coracana]